jgi:hypothetical protein
MKRLFILAAFVVAGFSMISCTADAVDEATPATVTADGEPGNTPIVIPPPPKPKP